MDIQRFKGVGVALITPFHEDKTIDFEAFGRIVNFVIDGGVDYLVVLGTTGENVTLSKDEKHELIRACVQINAGRVPIMAGFGGNDTAAIVQDLRSYDLQGVDAILSVSPYYNKPTQEGIFQHYKAVATATDLPVILYNVPGRTASNMRANTTLQLAKSFDNIIGIKEASNDWLQIFWLAREKPENFLLISGNDDLIVPQLSIGYDGVISVIANGTPRIFSTMVHEALSNNFPEAKVKSHQLDELVTFIFEQGNPAGIKAVLKYLGVCDDNVRLPLVPVNDDLRRRIITKVDQLKNRFPGYI
jgi:4-hydroxy-tetrahydrodipicolinate synthase